MRKSTLIFGSIAAIISLNASAGNFIFSYCYKYADGTPSAAPCMYTANESLTEWKYSEPVTNVPQQFGDLYYSGYARTGNTDLIVGVDNEADNEGDISRPVLIRSDDNGKSWNLLDLSPADTKVADFGNITCDNGECILIGSKRGDFHKDNLFMLTASGDMQSWKEITNLPPINKMINEYPSNCTSSYCVITASVYNNKTDGEDPVFFYTGKNKKEWLTAQLPHETKTIDEIMMNEVNCSGDTCVAVGYMRFKSVDHGLPALYVSHDRGANWERKTLVDQSGKLTTAQCHDHYCIAAGSYINSHRTTTKSMVAVSQDNGMNWTLQQPEQEQANAYDLRCTNKFCAYLEENVNTGKLNIKVSHDKGMTFSQPEIASFPDMQYPHAHGMSCTDKGCVIALHDDAQQNKSSILVSDGNGDKWTSATITDRPDSIYNQISHLVHTDGNSQVEELHHQSSRKNSMRHAIKRHRTGI
jgi:hypothetical protein